MMSELLLKNTALVRCYLSVQLVFYDFHFFLLAEILRRQNVEAFTLLSA